MMRRFASLFGFAAVFAVAASFAHAQDAGIGGLTARSAIQPQGQAGGAEVTHALIFDAITGAGANGTTSVPNTFIGEPIDGSAAGGTAPKLTGFDTAVVNFTGATVNTTNLRLVAYVWGTHLNTGAGNVFSNLLATYTVDFGPVSNFATNTFIPIESATPGVTPGVTLATPLQLTSNQNWGMTFNWQTETATPGTYVSTNNLGQVLRVTAPFAVGTPDFAAPNYGYYRNAGGENNGNFLFSSSRNIGVNSGVYMRAYAEAVPEPTMLGAIALGGMALVARRRKA